MYTSDLQILKLPEILIRDGKISGSAQFFEESGIDKQRFSHVKNQKDDGRAYHFTPCHIETVAKKYGINTNWIFGISDQLYLKNDKQKVNKTIKILTK